MSKLPDDGGKRGVGSGKYKFILPEPTLLAVWGRDSFAKTWYIWHWDVFLIWADVPFLAKADAPGSHGAIYRQPLRTIYRGRRPIRIK